MSVSPLSRVCKTSIFKQIRKIFNPMAINIRRISLTHEKLHFLHFSVQGVINALIDQYPSIWKKANIIPVHKKGSRQCKNNYRPISLLPVFGKLFEKLLFDSIYNHLCANGLLTALQSGFRPSDSTINQLLSISHKIYTGFEETPSRETRAVFLDFSKAFDKVWHEGLLYKLECNGIAGNLLHLIQNFLSNRKQRVLLNGKNSE